MTVEHQETSISLLTPNIERSQIHVSGPGLLLPLALAIIHLAISLPWLYRHGAGEPDSNAMLVGIYQSVLQGQWMSGQLYMVEGQPLYYIMAFAIQGLLRLKYDHLALAMNLLAALLSSGTTIILYKILSRFAENWTAFAIAALTVSSATIIEWSTFTHPVTLSPFLFFCSLFALVKALSDAPCRRLCRVAWFNLAVLCGAGSIAARADIVVLFHLYIIVPVVCHLVRPAADSGKLFWRNQVLTGGVTALFSAMLGIIFLQALTGSASAKGDDALPWELLEALLHYLNFIPLTDGLLEVAFGFGMAGTALFLAGLLLATARRKWMFIVLALLMITPPLAFSMTIVQPARRWIYPIYATALATAVLWSALSPLSPRKWMAIYGVAGIAINLYLLPAMGNALRRSGFPVDDHTLLYRATADVFAHHRINQEYLLRVYREVRDIRENAPDDSLIVGPFASRYYMMATYCQDGVAANTQMVRSDDDSFIVRMESLTRFYFAEIYRDSDPIALDKKPPAIYQFGTWLPPQWHNDDTPVYVLTPTRQERFSMWLRRP